jgi:hypothetical protein
VTRPRAADDFATIHARLDELRREREEATKQDAADEAPPRTDQRLLGTAEGRQRPDRSGWLTVSAGRRIAPGRTR